MRCTLRGRSGLKNFRIDRVRQPRVSPPTRTSIRLIEFQGQYFRVASEVVIGGKDFPITTRGDGADKEVDGRPGDALGSASVVDMCGFFVIGYLQNGLIEGA